MHRLTASIALALALFVPCSASAGILKKVAVQIDYNDDAPPIGWFVLNPGDVGLPSPTYLWPAAKGVNIALGKLDTALSYDCAIDYEDAIRMPGIYGTYIQVFKAKCTPLP